MNIFKLLLTNKINTKNNLKFLINTASGLKRYIKATDIKAIRNVVSHGAFDIRFDYGLSEYIIDFRSILSLYRFNRRYCGSELLDLYRYYDRLRNIQEFLIRMAYLKATLRLYFTNQTIS